MVSYFSQSSGLSWAFFISLKIAAINDYDHGEPVLNLKQAHKLGIKVPADFQQEAEQHGIVFK